MLFTLEEINEILDGEHLDDVRMNLNTMMQKKGRTLKDGLEIIKLRVQFDSIIRSHIMVDSLNNVLWSWVKKHAAQIKLATEEE